MGIITNGFLIGAKKSAGGINFLRLKGQQVFRNKPQVSAGYVPTPAQVLQRSLQAELTRSVRENLTLRNLIAYGWDRHHTKRSNANEFQREALRLFTRESDSTLSLIGDKESRMSDAASVGYDNYVISRMAEGAMPLTRSKWEFPFDAFSVNNGVVSLNASGMEAAKQNLGARYSQDFVNDEQFRIVVLELPGSISEEVLPYTPAQASSVVAIAAAAPAVRNGEVVGWVYSTPVTLDFNIVDDGTPRLSTASYNGVDVTTGQAVTAVADALLILTGYNLEYSDMEVHVTESGLWSPITDFFTNVQDTKTLVEAKTGPGLDGATVDGVRQGVTVLWPVA